MNEERAAFIIHLLTKTLKSHLCNKHLNLVIDFKEDLGRRTQVILSLLKKL